MQHYIIGNITGMYSLWFDLCQW